MASGRETRDERRERLAERVRTLPTEPGCYLMRGRDGEIFYVGKASSLRARLRSYFSGSDTRQFVDWLDDILYQIDYVVVRNEKEALLLERTLVREHQPRFNVKLRDDKNFIHLRLEVRPAPAGAPLRRQYPRVEVVRSASADGARTFGPFHSATSVRQTLRVLNRHFQLRTCRDAVIENRKRPCLQHQIGRCPAPCVTPVEDYAESVQEAALFLSGKTRELESRLRARMIAAADAERFEVAARVRDQLLAVTTSMDDQVVTNVDKRRDMDVVAAARSGSLLVLVRVIVRDGRMQGTDTHSFGEGGGRAATGIPAEGVPTEELVASFLLQLYGSLDPPAIPDDVLVGLDLGEDAAALAELLSERAGRAVSVRVPQRGHGRRLLEIAEKNAAAVTADVLRKKDVREKGLEALMRRLGMTRPPRVIECYDISLFQGTDAVASGVCFVDGQPEKARYRRYNIRTVEGTDDFSMLHEALVRRLKRGKAEGDLPDLILVDGGKGQLNVAIAACRDVRVPVANLGGAASAEGGVYLASIAKARSFRDERPETPREEPLALKEGSADADDELQASPERLFLPGVKDPIALRPHTADRFLVEQLRDEAHRFAITGHRGRRKRRTLRSVLDEIPGVGPARRRALLKELGGVDAIAVASVEQIASVPGVGRAMALRIKAALGDEAVDPPAPDDEAVDPPAPDDVAERPRAEGEG
jgi:excinuclease ABC subunit C